MEKVRSDIFVYALLNTIFAFLSARWNFLCPFSAPYLFFFYFFSFAHSLSVVPQNWELCVCSLGFVCAFPMIFNSLFYVYFSFCICECVCVCLLTLGFSCLNECCIKREKCSKPFSLFVCICFDLVLTWLVKSKGEWKRKTLANGSDA